MRAHWLPQRRAILAQGGPGFEKIDRVLGLGLTSALCALCAIFFALAVGMALGAYASGNIAVSALCAALAAGAAWLARHLFKHRRKLSDYDLS